MADPPEAPDLPDPLKTQAALRALQSSLSALSASSRLLPFDRDFHFYNNFGEFRDPIREIAARSQRLLLSIGPSSSPAPEDLGDESANDWLVGLNDEALERLDASVDEFQRVRKMEEESGKRIMDPGDDGFQLVTGKRKSKGASVGGGGSGGRVGETSNVKVAALRDKKVSGAVKPKIPFHIPTIKKPQEEYNILVNNSNQPFQHVWLQKSDDGERFIHPLEKLSVSDFVDKDVINIEPEKPLPLEDTPFKIVNDVKELKALATKLRAVNEFAVDLEHNQYRSFQGLTCLMQISTRTEDFVVDALKLRIHIGPYLREVFKDPAKKKVMHGADRDIVWLQRDFGIYVCNMFDTGQASRVLKLERNSLEYLLHHFCGVTANKEYQNADWRLRPLPEEMLRYAREDTHYLLYMYDLMRLELFKFSENSDSALVEVYQRSAEICMQLYEKELLTESSYLHIYGLQGANFSAQQLAIVDGLFEWRDVVARAEDESTGFILPNKVLLEIAKHMPINISRLRWIIKSKHPFIEKNLASVVNIVRHSMQNASAYESAAEQLKEARVAAIAPEENQPADDGAQSAYSDASLKLAATSAEITPPFPSIKEDSVELETSNSTTTVIPEPLIKDEEIKNQSLAENLSLDAAMSTINDTSMRIPSSPSVDGGAIVQVLKKPTRGLGALLGSSGPKRKFNIEKKDEGEKKLEEIRFSVTLPFHSFSGNTNEPMVEENRTEEPATNLEINRPEENEPETSPMQPCTSSAPDIIVLEDDSDEEGLKVKTSETAKESEDRVSVSSGMETDGEEEPPSLSELSSSFQKCLDSIDQDSSKNSWKVEKSSSKTLQVKPFDYEAARQQVKFGEEDRKVKLGKDRGKDGNVKLAKASGGKKNGSTDGQVQGSDGADELRQGRRRMAFPATGNRSVSFR